MNPGSSATFVMNLQRLISELVHNYELCEQMCANQYQVTVAQGYTLLILPRKGNVSMNELSQAMGLANSTMTRMVDQLVEKGLVLRAPDPKDRRIVRVGLTHPGQQVQQSLEEAQQEFLQTAFGDIQEDERSIILQSLNRVNQAITKAVKSCFPA